MINDIRVEGIFEAAHRLESFPKTHKCWRLHGHRWEVAITVRGEQDPKTGIVVDYYEVQRKLRTVLAEVDHYYLNERIPQAGDPTTENLCRWFWMRLHREGLNMLVEVRLTESPGFTCIYRGTGHEDPPGCERRDCPNCKRSAGLYSLDGKRSWCCSWCGAKYDERMELDR